MNILRDYGSTKNNNKTALPPAKQKNRAKNIRIYEQPSPVPIAIMIFFPIVFYRVFLKLIIFQKLYKAFLRLTEFSELEGIHKDCWVQLLK